MRIEQRIEPERPEDALDVARISELLTIVRLIADRHHGELGAGVLPCPICGGAIAYELLARNPQRHRVRAVCNRSGCIKFAT